MDKIPNDEKIPRKIHLRYHADFALKTFPIRFFVDDFSRRLERFQTLCKPAARDFFEIRMNPFARVFYLMRLQKLLRHFVLRQKDGTKPHRAIDRFGDFDRIFARLRRVLKRRKHFFVGLEIKIVDGKFAQFVGIDDLFHPVADEHRMRKRFFFL